MDSFELNGENQLTVPMDRRTPYLSFHNVKIFVRDLDQSLRFYVDRLGFDLLFDVRLQSGERWVAVAPSDGTAVLALVAPEPDSKEYELIGRPTHVVFVTEDVTSRYNEWRQRGVRFHHTPRLRRVKFERQSAEPPSPENSFAPAEQTPQWGGVFTMFRDLDGNSYTLAGFDEISREVEAQRRANAAKLEAERRATQELEIAKQVQARLFPQSLPPLKTLEYAGVCIQARQVGGDYYDFLDLGRDRVGLVIGDIAGKGMAAALLMANLQANLRSQCAIALDHPERFLQSVNQLFYDNTSESDYATLFFAEYNDQNQRLRYANCGHLCALLLRHDGALEKLDSTSTVLGIFPRWECSMEECRMYAGDTLALYTDGITESSNKGVEFGEQGLIDALRRHREEPCQDLVTSIVAEVQQFNPNDQYDDITLMIAKCRE
jgi:serine phosphatase RsbU (regulator of sigma subunit)/catechol 2,3-dioxygenase-like lactoylglutathione lyase family enzyme